MRHIGIITVLSVIVSAAAPNAPIYGANSTAVQTKAAASPSQPVGPAIPSALADKPAKMFVTAKSTAQFDSCFADKEDAGALPWWFVPKRGGGTFSNLGSRTMKSAYFVVISDRGPRREIRLEGNGGKEIIRP